MRLIYKKGGSAVSGKHQAGYTLVEIAFASFVVGVAFLALIGLGRMALRNAGEAENDTRAAMLAEDVFGTLRGLSDTLCATGGPSAWSAFWSEFADEGGPGVVFQTAGDEARLSYIEVDGSGTAPLIYGDGRRSSIEAVNFSDSMKLVPQWTAQFELGATPTNPFYGALTRDNETNDEYEFITGPESNITFVTLSLHIWPNAFDKRERSRSFFTHIPFKGLYHGQPVQ